MSASDATSRDRLLARPGIGILASLVVPLLVMATVWLPMINHYRVAEMAPTSQMIDAARTMPDDGLLRELRSLYLVRIAGRTPTLEVAAAERILQGHLELPNLPAARLSVPPAPADLESVPAGLELSYAAMVVPDLLLAAYVDTGRDTFFTAAEAFIAAWDRFERGSWGPVGLLWNDHAIAARVRVLAEFWRLYRDRPDYDPDVGRAVLAQAARYGSFLSNRDQFTFATNHGIIQNLGLLMLSLAFPSLPDSRLYHDIALERLGDQLEFLIDDVGVVRENSAGYQAFDLGLLAMTFRCMTLLGDPVPAAWADRYAAGLDLLAMLRRPDGTLPATGDTDGAGLGDFPPTTNLDPAGRASPLQPYADRRPIAPEVLDGAAGYWVDWTGLDGWPTGPRLGQTVLTWTSPPGPGHKHADELGLEIWSDGVAWLTSVGYWPYDDEGRGQAESWVGANAPHLVGEPATSVRNTVLLAHGRADEITAVDVERTGPGEYRVRRQVVRIDAETWIVLDVSGGSAVASQSVWTLSPRVELEPTEWAASYRLSAAGTSTRLDFVGSDGTRASAYRGSTTPFAGWQAVNGRPEAAPAVVVEQPPGQAWLMTLFARADATSPATDVRVEPTDIRVDSAERWAMTVPTLDGSLEIRRSGGTITVLRSGSAGPSTMSLALQAGADTGPELARVRNAFNAMAAAYPQFQPLGSRRTNVSILIALAMFGQTVVLLAASRWRRRLVLPLVTLAVVGWIVVGVWLGTVFVRSWEVFRLPA